MSTYVSYVRVTYIASFALKFVTCGIPKHPPRPSVLAHLGVACARVEGGGVIVSDDRRCTRHSVKVE